MAAPYIPPKDSDLDLWANNFADLITADPATYALNSTIASTIQAAVDAFSTAYALAVNPSTKTPVTVSNKDTQKFAMLPIVRTYSSQIRINAGVADADKIALGLNLPNNSPAPIPAPATQPVLTIMSATPLRHTVKFRDEASSPTSRAKAANAIGCEIWLGIDTVPLTDPADCVYYGAAVKVPFYIDYAPSAVGQIATLFGRWVNRAGSAGQNFALTGPWSAAASLTVVGTA